MKESGYIVIRLQLDWKNLFLCFIKVQGNCSEQYCIEFFRIDGLVYFKFFDYEEVIYG